VARRRCPAGNAARATKERQNAADAAQAATYEGIELRYGTAVD
jgi:hypothetical protein